VSQPHFILFYSHGSEPAGSTGSSGSAGSAGSSGAACSAGSTGSSGSRGSAGSTGSSGAAGSAGSDGSAGSAGSSLLSISVTEAFGLVVLETQKTTNKVSKCKHVVCVLQATLWFRTCCRTQCTRSRSGIGPLGPRTPCGAPGRRC